MFESKHSLKKSTKSSSIAAKEQKIVSKVNKKRKAIKSAETFKLTLATSTQIEERLAHFLAFQVHSNV
jgi:hypothetical protein